MSTKPARPWVSLGKLTVFTAAVVVAAYLLARHPNHTWQLLPYALLLACLLIHSMHHGRHRHRR